MTKISSFVFSLIAILFFAMPAWAVDVTMGAEGMLMFSPSEINIATGDTVHFVNGVLPPHNVIVEDHAELSHDGLAFASGESLDITFPDEGDFIFWCDPHKGAGMTGTIHVG